MKRAFGLMFACAAGLALAACSFATAADAAPAIAAMAASVDPGAAASAGMAMAMAAAGVTAAPEQAEDAAEARAPVPMLAKVRVGSVAPFQHEGATVQERLVFHGVAKSGGYPDDGSDEDNTFARFSPSLLVDLQLANPALFGKFQPGDTFYLRFEPIDQPAP
jgi:hypothetical protein